MQRSTRPKIFAAVCLGMFLGSSCSPDPEGPPPVEPEQMVQPPKQNSTQVPEQNLSPGRLTITKAWAVTEVVAGGAPRRLITTRYEAEEGPVNVTATIYMKKDGNGTLREFATRAYLDGETTQLGDVETTSNDNTVAFTVKFEVNPGSPVTMTFCVEVNNNVQLGSVHLISLEAVNSNATLMTGLPIEQQITVVAQE